MTLKLYDTLTRAKRDFVPIDPAHVRMYVCGPTVYDFAHIGNARPVIVFDVLFRLLRHLYGESHVTYVRNITDVDDKINARAVRDYPGVDLNLAIGKVTEVTEAQFQADVTALGCLPPTHQPRATAFVLPRPDGRTDMKSLIQKLLDRGNAYLAIGVEGKEVLFDVTSMPDYGALSGRKLEDQKAGARIAVDAHKWNPGDFVLWKESGAKEPGWSGKFEFVPNPNSGYDAEFIISPENASDLGLNSRVVAIHGRPGWHIECSAMSAAYLGNVFDIHGGGLDLIFPHHENEIAQSRCAHGTRAMANFWMHNGFLQVEGEKMSKSLGNFITIRQLLRGWHGEAWSGASIRLAMLDADYTEPLDWTRLRLAKARDEIARYAHVCQFAAEEQFSEFWVSEPIPTPDILNALCENLNFHQAMTAIRDRYKYLSSVGVHERIEFLSNLRFLGFFRSKEQLFAHPMGATFTSDEELPINVISNASRLSFDLQAAAANGDFQMVGSTSLALEDLGFQVVHENSKYSVRYVGSIQKSGPTIQELVDARSAARLRKDFTESDRIRDQLVEMRVILKDSKDPETGKLVTTWEFAR